MALLCAACRTELDAGRLACPACGALVHSERLKQLAARAGEGDLEQSRAAWTEALTLLPAGSKQHAIVTSKLDALTQQLGAPPAPPPERSGWVKRAGPIGAALLVIAGKLKLLALGLTKMSTLLSMLLSFGVYWTAFGWKFAGGLIASIYVHEMGHVAALRKRNVPADGPMFIPGIGALVRLKKYPSTPADDARVGLAGPLWGLVAAGAFELAHLVTGGPLYAALARAGAWINLFNLLPVWQLDGGRGFHALSRNQRWLASAVILAAWLVTSDGLLLLLFLAALLRALGKDAPTQPDHGAFALYAILIASLAALARDTLVAATP